MSIEFVIIPVLKEFEEYALKIKDKLKSNIKIKNHFQIDTYFDENINSRINKWKKDDYDIIIIDEDCIKTNNINVTFSEKGSYLDLEEFIELVNSLEDQENDSDSDSDNEDSYESNCIIV
jgi:threonyl-tRNA synthetase